jgi:hypothetical protein
MLTGNYYFTFISASVPVYLIFLIYTIIKLRQEHSSEINTLWFIYSLTTCLSYIIFLTWPSTDFGTPPPLTGSEGIYSITNTLNFIVGLLTDYIGELSFIIVAFVLIVIPQLMNFILSGIWGCASRSMAVQLISQYSTLSLVKFFAYKLRNRHCATYSFPLTI